MESEKISEEFEAWHGKEVAMLVMSANAKAAFALELNKDALFYVWKASRESLVIELPDRNTKVDEYDGWQTWDDCKASIEAAGLKVKP